MIQAVLCAVMGYMIGGINPAMVIGKLKGVDIRKEGNGNPGASNTVVVLGAKWGVVVAAVDILKAFAASFFAKMLFPELEIAGVLAGVACILGHMYPVIMGFRGGKGLACLVGTILGYDLKVFAILIGVLIVLTFVLDYIVVMTIAGSIAFPIVYAFQTHNVVGTAVILVATAAILSKHIINIKKILNGTEIHLSILWRRDEELARVEERKKKL